MTFVDFECPACGKNLKAKVELAGKRAKCSRCGDIVKVPIIDANMSPKTKTAEGSTLNELLTTKPTNELAIALSRRNFDEMTR